MRQVVEAVFDASPDLAILYEDNHLLALNKPAGMLTQPSGRLEANLEDLAKKYIKETRNKPGNVFLHAVHRLDRVVSGIALFASTDKSLSRMNEKMRQKKVVRIYHALLTSPLPLGEGTLVHFLRHSRFRSLPADEHEPGARKSVLTYRMLGTHGRFFLAEITLQTGRYHQIRAQLSASGFPIVGDTVYGSDAPFSGKGIALHHRRMEFTHPVKNTDVAIEAAYPDTWPCKP